MPPTDTPAATTPAASPTTLVSASISRVAITSTSVSAAPDVEEMVTLSPISAVTSSFRFSWATVKVAPKMPPVAPTTVELTAPTVMSSPTGTSMEILSPLSSVPRTAMSPPSVTVLLSPICAVTEPLYSPTATNPPTPTVPKAAPPAIWLRLISSSAPMVTSSPVSMVTPVPMPAKVESVPLPSTSACTPPICASTRACVSYPSRRDVLALSMPPLLVLPLLSCV